MQEVYPSGKGVSKAERCISMEEVYPNGIMYPNEKAVSKQRMCTQIKKVYPTGKCVRK